VGDSIVRVSGAVGVNGITLIGSPVAIRVPWKGLARTITWFLLRMFLARKGLQFTLKLKLFAAVLVGLV
jgi:hypothetical protein